MIITNLSSFLPIAVVRNGSDFTINKLELNVNDTIVSIVGTVNINEVPTETRWNTDGLNKNHGSEYDLVKIITYDDFMGQ